MIFDITQYRKIDDSYHEKLKYINRCIYGAEKVSAGQVVIELEFIRLQIREYCGMEEYLMPQNIPTGRMGIGIADASILNHVNRKILYYTELKIINKQKAPQSAPAEYPPMRDCFKDGSYFDSLLKNPKLFEFISETDDGYRWMGSKEELGGFAKRLKDKDKLIDTILDTNQDCARVFCPFFHVEFNAKSEKSFQANRAEETPFTFI